MLTEKKHLSKEYYSTKLKAYLKRAVKTTVGCRIDLH